MLIRIINAVQDRSINWIGKQWLRNKGVRLGRHVHLHGLPIVTLAERTLIDIGDEVVLCSQSKATALGVSKPVILRTLYPEARISIGFRTGLSGTVICAAMRVSIGPECLIGADVQIVDTDFHPIAADRRHCTDQKLIAAAPVTIGRNVFLGSGSKVLKGVSIGNNAVIGAGSVVTRDVPENAIAAGNPARVIGSVSDPVSASAQLATYP